jgi:hypothetical protein
MSNKNSSPALSPEYLHRAINAALCPAARDVYLNWTKRSRKSARGGGGVGCGSIYCVISHGMANYRHHANTFSRAGVSRARNKTPSSDLTSTPLLSHRVSEKTTVQMQRAQYLPAPRRRFCNHHHSFAIPFARLAK